MLRLVDNECHIPTQVRFVEEALLNLRPQGPEIVRCHRHRQTVGQQGKNVHKGVTRLPEHQCGEVRRSAGQIGMHQRRFPHARRAREDHQALAGGNPLRQRVQRGAVTRTHKEQGRVRGQGERCTLQPVIIEIHSHLRVLGAAMPHARQPGDLRARPHALIIIPARVTGCMPPPRGHRSAHLLVGAHGRRYDTIAAPFLVRRCPHGRRLCASLAWPRHTRARQARAMPGHERHRAVGIQEVYTQAATRA